MESDAVSGWIVLKLSWIIGPLGFPGVTSGKEHSCRCRRRKRYGFDLWVGKIPWREGMEANSSILAWRIPWTEKRIVHEGHKELGTTEASMHVSVYGEPSWCREDPLPLQRHTHSHYNWSHWETFYLDHDYRVYCLLFSNYKKKKKQQQKTII